MTRLASVLTGLCGVMLALLLGACAATQPAGPEPSDAQQSTTPSLPPLTPVARSETGPGAAQDLPEHRETVTLSPGTGNFINTRAASRPIVAEQPSGDVTLNFEAASIRDVVKVVFDLLGDNYVMDPQVQGEATIQTSRPLPRDLLIPTLETLLAMNQAALVHIDGLYKVIPVASAVASGPSPRLAGVRTGPGYGVRIVPLRYIGAAEMQKILEPFLGEASVVRVDTARNMLMLAGTAQALANLQETIDIFDVNWLRGMSVGMYRLQNVDSQTVATELDSLFGQDSKLPLAGMFRFVPVAQLNAVLVITPQPEYLREAGRWVERLDGAGGERLYVYAVQNGSADYIASVLSQIFGAGAPGAGAPPASVAPGLSPARLTSASPLSSPSGYAQGAGGGLSQTAGQQAGGLTQRETLPEAGAEAAPSAPQAAQLGVGAEQVRIVADTANNAILIWASSQTYEKILEALRKLDIRPRQVLIEATIAEVTLKGALEYGLQWFFKNNGLLGDKTGTGSLGLNVNRQLTTVLSQAAANSFSYALSDNAGIVRAFLNTLASESKLKVLSSPQLMVIDNQEAKITVGRQQPILTSTTVTEGGTTIQSIQLKDTGVILNVRPQVKSGGLVTMDIIQEVTNVGPEDPATEQNTFDQRTISSRVAVQSGQSLVLGGLIQDRKDRSQSGFPGLYKLPVIGPLFGTTTNNSERTELVVLITPRVIEDSRDTQEVIDDLKRKMKEVMPILGKVG